VERFRDVLLGSGVLDEGVERKRLVRGGVEGFVDPFVKGVEEVGEGRVVSGVFLSTFACLWDSLMKCVGSMAVTHLVICVLKARRGAIRDLLCLLLCRLAGANHTGASILERVHAVLKSYTDVLLLFDTLLVAAEVVALAVLDAFLDIPEAFLRTPRLLLHYFRGIGEREAGKGRKIVHQETALGGDALPYDGQDGAERAAHGVEVGRNLFLVWGYIGRVDGGGDIALGEVPEGLLQHVVLCRKVRMRWENALKCHALFLFELRVL
jgi:hypothetical protein